MKHNKSILYTFLLLTGFLLAQGSQQDVKILSVSVEGNNLTSDTMVKYTAGLNEGNQIQLGDFSRSVKRLWQLGLFSDVQILLDSETPEGISITIKVAENPVLGKVIYKGNKKLKDKKFEEELELTSGQRIKPFLIDETIAKMKELYAEDGYLRVEIEASLEEPNREELLLNEKLKEHAKNIVFKIKENKKVKTGRIIFEGNEAYSDFRLRRVLKETKQQRWYLFWRSPFDKNKFEEDKNLLGVFYRNHGYRDFAITSDTTSFTGKKLNIVLKVTEGPRYKYRNFSWEGNTLYSDDELKRRLGLSKGENYGEEDFNLGVYERMQSLYMDRGYIYSQIQPQVTPIGKDSLDVHFIIQENHKVYVRNIFISGNSRTRENVIRRELKLFPGDVFNRNKLIRSQREVWVLNYFSDVVPDVLPVDEDEVDLEITVEEKSSDRAQANIGFTGEYGMTGGGGLEFNNFRGLGQRLNISFNTGTNYSLYTNTEPSKYRSASISFTDPMIFDTPNLVGFSLFYSFRGASTNYYFPLDFITQGGSAKIGRRFRFPDDYFRGDWSIQAVKKTYEGTEEELEEYVASLRETRGISATQVISRYSLDRPEFPTMGSRFTWAFTWSGGILGGNEDYQKHVLDLDWYTPTFWKFVLKSSLNMGVIKPLKAKKDEVSIIPFDEKFIMGGNGIPYGNMLRGYPDNSIGPKSSSGSPVGGNAMLKLSTEFRVPFSENPVVYGLVFFEMGNVWRTIDMTEPFYMDKNGPLDLKRSIGAGIRFFMPMIGMLGFDYGYGFDDINGNGKPQGWEYTITFGQTF